MFIEDWQNVKKNLYPGDEFLLNEDYCVYFKSFNDYVISDLFGNPYDRKLHIGLKPVPYIGNLNKSSIFLLMLNPGLNPSDYIQDDTLEFNKLYNNNLFQKGNEDFPFFILNPQICTHSGYSYWFKKLRLIIEKIKKTENISWLEAQEKISKKIALLELIPYHSKNFGLSDKIINKMNSVRTIKNYVKKVLVPKARNHECVIIVMRSSKNWELEPEEKIVVYNNVEARAGSLGVNSRGYEEIIKQLNYNH
ncbi:MAG: hypothetical protein ACFFG0_08330 [Candidatus Thorarchaeota archaeon]